jgi:hypothetical protein
MKKRKFSMHRFVFLLFLGLIGCHKVTYTSTGAPGQSHYINKIFLFWGLIGSEEINVKAFCPTGVYQIQQRRDPGGILISYLTAGIIMPMTIEVQCQSMANTAWFDDSIPSIKTKSNRERSHD